MTRTGWVVTCAGVGLLAAACGDRSGQSEVHAFDASTGQALWTKSLDAETSQLWGVGCASRTDPQGKCRDDVAVIHAFDNCRDPEPVAIDPKSGREIQTPSEAQVPLYGDQRLDSAWIAGASTCRQMGDGEPYFAGIAPMVDGVCLLNCVGPNRAGCTLAAVDATTGEELWRKEVGEQRNITARGSLLLVAQDNVGANAASEPYALSYIDVHSGSELWSLSSATPLRWAGAHGEQVFLSDGQRLLSVSKLDASVSFDVPSRGGPAGVVGDVAFLIERVRESECPTPG